MKRAARIISIFVLLMLGGGCIPSAHRVKMARDCEVDCHMAAEACLKECSGRTLYARDLNTRYCRAECNKKAVECQESCEPIFKYWITR